jgi:Flp pilus assembly pilin Flp
MRAPAQRRLLDDERGLGTIEFVVLLVLVLALAVSVWNLFGNGVACAFSSAVESFDGSKRPEAKCGEPTAGARPPGGRHGSAAGRASSAPGGQPASQPLSAQQPAVAGSAPVAPTSPSSSSTTSSEATEPTLTETLTNGLATFGEHVLDFTEGIVAGANPLTPVVPVELRPTFGHQVTYGAGQIVGSVVGLLDDAGNIIAGGTGVVASGALIVASDGTLVWVALPAMAGSGALASAGVAAAAGHGTNFMEGIDNVLHGENQGSGSTSEKPPTNEKPQAKEKPQAEQKPAKTESGYPRDFSSENTVNRSATYASERDARNTARTKLGRNPVQVEPGKLRSQDGRWQYRGKPADLEGHGPADSPHVHLERLDPVTGEVLENWHFRW